MGFGREKHDPTRSIKSQKTHDTIHPLHLQSNPLHDLHSISSQKSMITKSSHDPNRSISSNSVLLHPVSETHGQKKQVRKIPLGFGRNLVSDGVFLISVDLITVTIQRFTYTLNSYINPYSLPHMHCRLLMLLLGVFVSAGRSVFP
jgi:hypothetical protein